MEKIKKVMNEFDEIPNPPESTLQEGEMIRTNKTTGKMEGSGDINTDLEVNFGNKTVVAGTGTFKLGEAHAMSSGGENVIFTNQVDEDQFNPVWVDQQNNEATARFTVGDFTQFTAEDQKDIILINPSWPSNPIADWRVTQLIFEVDTTITNCVFNVLKDGKDFYSAKIGTLVGNAETVIDLTVFGRVPVDAFIGGSYTVSLSSPDGDVRTKGGSLSLRPFFIIGYFEIVDELIATGVSGPDVGTLQDKEMIRYNATTGKLEGSKDKSSDDKVDFGLKTVKMGTNSTEYGEAIRQGVGGESIVFTDLIDNDFFRIPTVLDNLQNAEFSAPVDGVLREVTQESSKADVLTNPTWQADPPVDWRVQSLRFESAATQTNCFFEIVKQGTAIVTVSLGTLTADVEKLIDLTDPALGNLPYEIGTGTTYDLRIYSTDGDVQMKGSLTSGQPFGVVQYYQLVERTILDDNSTEFGRLENVTTIRSNGPATYIQSTGERRFIPYQVADNSQDPTTTVTQNLTASTVDTVMTGIELEYVTTVSNVLITVIASSGTQQFFANIVGGVPTTVQLPKPMELLSLENYSFIIDNRFLTAGSNLMNGFDPGGGNPFEIYFRVEVEDPKIRNLDPDQRMQNRFVTMPIKETGYQSQIGGGVIEDQGWIDQSTGTAALLPVDDTLGDGLLSLESRDLTSGGLSQMTRPIDDTDIQGALDDLYEFGGFFRFNERSETEGTGTSAVAGFGFSGAQDPGWKAGVRGRFLVTFALSASNTQVIIPEGGSEFDTGIPRNQYLDGGVLIKPGTMVADIIVNGEIVVADHDFSGAASNDAYDGAFVYGSGGTSATSRLNFLRDLKLTVFRSGPQLPFSQRLIEDNAWGALPLFVYRDWTMVFTNDDVELGSDGELYLPNWGTITLSRIGDEITFNGISEMVIQGPGTIEITQVNIDDAKPDKNYQITFSGGAARVASTTDIQTLATPGLTNAERLALIEVRQDNSQDVNLGPDQTTQDALSLAGQELSAEPVTQTTDGVMLAEDKLKLDNISGNHTGDSWVIGLAVTESDPKAQTVDYTSGSYLINGIAKSIATGGTYDLENGYGAVNHYSDLTSYQHRFVLICVDNDEVIKSVGGPAAEKNETPDLPPLADDTVCVAIVEVKVDSGAIPKEIKDKQITDTRNAPAFNTDELVSVSADDTTTGYLSDKLSNNGNVTFTIENVGGSETIKADSTAGGVLPSIDYSTNAHIDNFDVTSLYPRGHIFCNAGGDIEVKSFANGQDKQIIMVSNLSLDFIKIKDENGAGQQIRCEGSSDTTMDRYGGVTLVYNATTGFWYTLQIT